MNWLPGITDDMWLSGPYVIECIDGEWQATYGQFQAIWPRRSNTLEAMKAACEEDAEARKGVMA